MRLPIWRCLPFALCLCLDADAIGAQTLRGRVLDAATGRNLSQALVSALDAARDTVLATALADGGMFNILLPDPGAYRLRVELLGYTTLTTAPVTVVAQAVITLELRLEVDAIAIEPLRVVAERTEPMFMADIRRRNRMGFGTVLTREQLDQRNTSRLDDVLRDAGLPIQLYEGELPGRTVILPLVLGRQASMGPARECWSSVYLDGLLISAADWFDPDAPPGRREAAIENMRELWSTRPGDIEAIEIYRGAAGVPAEYSGSNAECGVIAIWTRRGYEDTRAEENLVLPPLRVRAGVRGGNYRLSGFHTPAPATFAELTTSVLMTDRVSAVVYARYGTSTLAASSTSYLAATRARPAPDVGPRPLRIYALGAEPRVALLPHARIRPIVGARAELLRRTVSLPATDESNATRTHGSNGWGIGASAGVELDITRRITLDVTYARDRLSFGRYANLDEWERTTASQWQARSLRAGIVVGM